MSTSCIVNVDNTSYKLFFGRDKNVNFEREHFISMYLDSYQQPGLLTSNIKVSSEGEPQSVKITTKVRDDDCSKKIFSESGNIPHIVIETVENGVSLMEWITSKDQASVAIEEDVIATFSFQLIWLVAKLHSQYGIIHNNINFETIMVKPVIEEKRLVFKQNNDYFEFILPKDHLEVYFTNLESALVKRPEGKSENVSWETPSVKSLSSSNCPERFFVQGFKPNSSSDIYMVGNVILSLHSHNRYRVFTCSKENNGNLILHYMQKEQKDSLDTFSSTLDDTLVRKTAILFSENDIPKTWKSPEREYLFYLNLIALHMSIQNLDVAAFELGLLNAYPYLLNNNARNFLTSIIRSEKAKTYLETNLNKIFLNVSDEFVDLIQSLMHFDTSLRLGYEKHGLLGYVFHPYFSHFYKGRRRPKGKLQDETQYFDPPFEYMEITNKGFEKIVGKLDEMTKRFKVDKGEKDGSDTEDEKSEENASESEDEKSVIESEDELTQDEDALTDEERLLQFVQFIQQERKSLSTEQYSTQIIPMYEDSVWKPFKAIYRKDLDYQAKIFKLFEFTPDTDDPKKFLPQPVTSDDNMVSLLSLAKTGAYIKLAYYAFNYEFSYFHVERLHNIIKSSQNIAFITEATKKISDLETIYTFIRNLEGGDISFTKDLKKSSEDDIFTLLDFLDFISPAKYNDIIDSSGLTSYSKEGTQEVTVKFKNLTKKATADTGLYFYTLEDGSFDKLQMLVYAYRVVIALMASLDKSISQKDIEDSIQRVQKLKEADIQIEIEKVLNGNDAVKKESNNVGKLYSIYKLVEELLSLYKKVQKDPNMSITIDYFKKQGYIQKTTNAIDILFKQAQNDYDFTALKESSIVKKEKNQVIANIATISDQWDARTFNYLFSKYGNKEVQLESILRNAAYLTISAYYFENLNTVTLENIRYFNAKILEKKQDLQAVNELITSVMEKKFVFPVTSRSSLKVPGIVAKETTSDTVKSLSTALLAFIGVLKEISQPIKMDALIKTPTRDEMKAFSRYLHGIHQILENNQQAKQIFTSTTLKELKYVFLNNELRQSFTMRTNGTIEHYFVDDGRTHTDYINNAYEFESQNDKVNRDSYFGTDQEIGIFVCFLYVIVFTARCVRKLAGVEKTPSDVVSKWDQLAKGNWEKHIIVDLWLDVMYEDMEQYKTYTK
jgi:hypothetical protein